ncbi:MAG: peptidase S41, partial [Bacteroidaceae bacterium]|nr:peptidase S41 [Bacteroidaceae bacterium]
MKKALLLLAFSFSLFTFTSCVKEDYYDNSKQGNYEALWRIMNEHYCFFDYKKQELGVDWDEIHARYAYKINESMTNAQLFEVLCNMLAELQDGHVNLSAPFDFGRNWSFYEDYPENYNDSIAKLYLGHNYQIAS